MVVSDEIDDFYRSRLNEFGPSAEGVGWKDSAAQYIRFEQLIRIINEKGSFSINDLGCGTGELITLLDKEFKSKFTYKGYDSVKEMIEIGREKYNSRSDIDFISLSDYSQLERCDYSVSSGIFNVRNSIPDGEWLAYILKTVEALSKSSKKGFAFNALTKYSDPERMRPDLFYSDPLFLFDFCKKHFGRNVALLHDYEIYDFTILVRKDL